MTPLSDEDREHLVAYLDGELDEEAARTIEARLNTDPAMRAEAEALKQAWELLDYLPRPEPSVSFTHRTMERLALGEAVSTMRMPRPQRTGRWLFRLTWVAAAALAFGLGFALARRQGPTLPPSRPFEAAEVENTMAGQLRLLENKPLYDKIDDLDFLKQLDRPDLFGKDGI